MDTCESAVECPLQIRDMNLGEVYVSRTCTLHTNNCLLIYYG